MRGRAYRRRTAARAKTRMRFQMRHVWRSERCATNPVLVGLFAGSTVRGEWDGWAPGCRPVRMDELRARIGEREQREDIC